MTTLLNIYANNLPPAPSYIFHVKLAKYYLILTCYFIIFYMTHEFIFVADTNSLNNNVEVINIEKTLVIVVR